MKKLAIKLSILGALLVGFLGAGSVVNHAFAVSSNGGQVCEAIGSGSDCTSGSSPDLSSVIKVIINVLSVIVGLIAVIMIIVSGLKYVTSGGDSNGVSSAKNTIIYAIVGLIIVAFAQFIVQFVLHKTATPGTASCPTGQVLDSKTNKCVNS